MPKKMNDLSQYIDKIKELAEIMDKYNLICVGKLYNDNIRITISVWGNRYTITISDRSTYPVNSKRSFLTEKTFKQVIQ